VDCADDLLSQPDEEIAFSRMEDIVYDLVLPIYINMEVIRHKLKNTSSCPSHEALPLNPRICLIK